MPNAWLGSEPQRRGNASSALDSPEAMAKRFAEHPVAVAETLTPATARGAFLMMQIERERERAALTRATHC